MNLENGLIAPPNARQPKGKGGSGVAAKSGRVKNGKEDGRFQAARGLSAMQHAFCRAMLTNGFNQSAAAKVAGYKNPAIDGCRLMQNSCIRDYLRERREAILSGKLASVALQTLGDIMQDETAPAAARVSAAKWVLEAGGHGLENRRLALKSIDPDDKPLSERTAAELEEFIARQTAIMDGMRQVSAPVIDVDSSQDADCEGDAED